MSDSVSAVVSDSAVSDSAVVADDTSSAVDLVCRIPWGGLSVDIKDRLLSAEKALEPLLIKASAVPSPLLVNGPDDKIALLRRVPADLKEEWGKWASYVLNCRGLNVAPKLSDEFKRKLGGAFSAKNRRAWAALLPHCRQDREFLTPAELTDDVQEQLSALRLIFSVCGGDVLSSMLPVPLLFDNGQWKMAFSGQELQTLIDDNEIKFFGRFDIRLKSVKKNGAFVKKAVWFN